MRESLSLWDSSAEEPDHVYPFEGEQRTRVCIIGGGFTGLSTALHLAERKIDCVVLEAEQIGYGGSGRNVGLVNAGLWLPPSDVVARLGQNYGPSFIDTLANAPEYVFSLIEMHQMRCEPTRNGTLHAAHSAAGFGDLKRRFNQWQAMSAPVELLDRAQASELIGTDQFHGALLDRRAGTINPMGYARGLARAGVGAGALIYTGVTANRIEKNSGRWRIQCSNGSIEADFVILGTNAYTGSLWPGLNKVFTPIHYFQLATEPLGDHGQHILPQRQGLWDTGSIMFSLRRDRQNRLIIGSMGKIHGASEGLSERWARRRIKKLFPELGPARFEHRWFGRIAMTPDHLPRILKLADGIYTPIGYNGRGITPGTIFGRAVAAMIDGEPPESLPLPVSEISTVAHTAIRSRFYELVFTANQWLKS